MVSNCTISDNSAQLWGSGIFNGEINSPPSQFTMTITNSTVTGNAGDGIANGSAH